MKKPKKKIRVHNLTHAELPASVGLVKEVRDELRADIQVVRHELGSVRDDLSAKIEKVTVAVHRTQVLMEEQRSENRIVLDGLKTVIDRIDRVESAVAAGH